MAWACTGARPIASPVVSGSSRATTRRLCRMGVSLALGLTLYVAWVNLKHDMNLAEIRDPSKFNPPAFRLLGRGVF